MLKESSVSNAEGEIAKDRTIGVQRRRDDVPAGTERGGESQREREIPVPDDQNALPR